MSTRCQIGFYASEKAKIESAEVFFYKHSDGYPEGVIPTLRAFCERFNAARGLRDTSYAVARWVQWFTNDADAAHEAFITRTRRKPDGEMQTLGFGIDREIHGDIEFFYHVSPSAIQVFKPMHDKEFNINGFELIKTIVLGEAKATAE